MNIKLVEKVCFKFGLCYCNSYIGCPRCQITCNQVLKDKLEKCFPDMKMESYSSLFATESGKVIKYYTYHGC